MSKTCAAGLLVSFVLLGSACSKNVVDRHYGVAIRFPTAPSKTVAEDKFFGIQVPTYTAEADGRIYTLRVFENPVLDSSVVAEEDKLDRVLGSVVIRERAKEERSRRTLTRGGHNGVESVMLSMNKVVTAQVFHGEGERYYLAFVAMNNLAADSPAIAAYLDSLQILPIER